MSDDLNQPCPHCTTMREALDDVEIELIALKDVRDILIMIPIEHPPPIYLVNRMLDHIDSLDTAFKRIFKS